jgi:hypothetical protein
MSTGLIYTLTGDICRGQVEGYHRKPDPLKLNKTRYKYDMTGMTPKLQAQVMHMTGTEAESRFTIGMEVEKNSFHRNAVREYELFCGFERDGSCGFEAVTHILPLLPRGTWRTKVYDLMHKAEKIIDDRFSPSNSNCGGHVTLSVNGMSGNELLEAVRNYSGIILALFRYRLKNRYCGKNTNMRVPYSHEWYNSRFDGNGCMGVDRYQLALVKGDLLEFRVVSRYESVKQMMRRYELFYELVNFAVNRKGSHGSFIALIRNLVIEMYDGNVRKADEILNMAVHFQKFINTGVIHESISTFLRD